MNEWLSALQQYHQQAIPCVLVTVIGVKGSLPRGVGSKMVVTEGLATGSIGGGGIELQAMEHARAMLRQQQALTTREINGGQSAGVEAAGLSLLFEPFWPADFQLMVFGAGHVGCALVQVMAPLPCRIVWVDDRSGIFPGELPVNVRTVVSEQPETEVASALPGCYFLLMSHSHDLDFRIGEAVLARDDFGYFGMLGSARKRADFERRMIDRGMTAEHLRKSLVCPIGLHGLSGRLPAEIAIAVAAELLLLRDSGR